MTARLAIRVSEGNPNHHIYDNNGVFWLHFTVHRPDFTKERVRRSLGTRDIARARVRRDAFLARLGAQIQGGAA